MQIRTIRGGQDACDRCCLRPAKRTQAKPLQPHTRPAKAIIQISTRLLGKNIVFLSVDLARDNIASGPPAIHATLGIPCIGSGIANSAIFKAVLLLQAKVLAHAALGRPPGPASQSRSSSTRCNWLQQQVGRSIGVWPLRQHQPCALQPRSAPSAAYDHNISHAGPLPRYH